MEKKTKAIYFNELIALVNATVEDEAERADYVDFLEKQVAALEKRKEYAKNKAAEKKEASDELTERIYGVIGADLMTVDEIVLAVDEEDVTRNKVTSRLGKLVKAGRIVKEAVRVEKNRRMAYRLPSEDVETVEE